MNAFTLSTVRTIVFEEGAVLRIGNLAAERGWRRVLLVTDPGVLKVGLVEPARKALVDAGIAVELYADVEADPPERIIHAAAGAATAFEADAIIGLGGGSSLDVAKLVALLAVGRETLAEVYGVGKARGPRLPLMLIPTTAGTGSEVTPVAIVTTGASEKMGVVSPMILPDIALLDPELTLGLPASITAATGIDAMVHAIEAYTSINPNNNAVSRALACEALRLMGGAIETAVHSGSDRAARSAMLLGSMLAGQAFANAAVGAVHALAYPIGGHFHVPHGLCNALVLPHVLRFNAETEGNRYADLALVLFPDLAEVGIQGRGSAFADALAGLTRRCGLPTKLREVGIPETAIEMLATDAMKQTRLLVNNPRPVTQSDALAIYRASW